MITPPATPTELELARQLRELQIDSHRVVAVLLGKLDGAADITTAELVAFASTTITQTPHALGDGFRLTVEHVTA